VRPSSGGEPLKVHAPPSCLLEIGQACVLAIDPGGVAVLG